MLRPLRNSHQQRHPQRHPQHHLQQRPLGAVAKDVDDRGLGAEKPLHLCGLGTVVFRGVSLFHGSVVAPHTRGAAGLGDGGGRAA